MSGIVGSIGSKSGNTSGIPKYAVRVQRWRLGTAIAGGSADPAFPSHWNWSVGNETAPEATHMHSYSANLVSNTSGYWSFLTTGYFHMSARTYTYAVASAYNYLEIWATHNNSTYQRVTRGSSSNYTAASEQSTYVECYFKVTDIVNQKWKFTTTHQGGGSTVSYAHADFDATSFIIKKIGEI
jgi:hypothetical protein